VSLAEDRPDAHADRPSSLSSSRLRAGRIAAVRRYQPIGNDFAGSSLKIETGRELIPGISG
jgi:hypothetical protein